MTRRPWSFLSACQTHPTAVGCGSRSSPSTPRPTGMPLLRRDQPGDPQPAPRQRFSTDGRTGRRRFPTVAPSDAGLRPGMANVVQRPDGSYLMTYEVCGTGDRYDCAVHYRTSADGANWGAPTDIGPMIHRAGQYFTHTPTIAWLTTAPRPAGSCWSASCSARRAARSPPRTATPLVDTGPAAGTGPRRRSGLRTLARGNDCPNYSSTLVPLGGRHALLEIATDYVGSVCQPFYATGSVAGHRRLHRCRARVGRHLPGDRRPQRHLPRRLGRLRVPGGNIEQWTCNALGPQNFRFTHTAAGDFTLTGRNSGLCVSVAGGSTAAGVNVDQETCTGTAAQRWQALNQGDGYWTFRNTGSGLCLDVAGGSAAGANVQQWTCNKLSPQIWKLEPR